MAIENRSDAAEIRAAASVLLERLQWMRQAGITFGGSRDLYEILGFARELNTRDYRARYARGGIAKRIVESLPKACWRGGAELVEDEDPDTSTKFEQAWEELEKRLHIWATLLRADILAGLSTYSVLLIGAPGLLSEELPKGKSDSLLYLTPFCGGGGPVWNNRQAPNMDADATIQSYITDVQNPRFGLPEFYQLRRLDVVTPDFQVPVHWSRIIHLAEGTLDDEVFGPPRLEACWNDLDSLDKVVGGGAEAFWLRANQGIQLDVDKDMSLTPEAKIELQNQAEEYQHQMRRMLRTRGVTVTPLGSDVANFSNPADAILTLIAGTTGIPKRVLTGSEMGSLASEQDRDNWSDQVNGRREGYCGPNIVRPLVDRLIDYGYLPQPKEYEVVWPDINTLTASEKAAGAKTWAETATAEGPVFTRDEVRDFWYAMEPLPKPEVGEDGNPLSEDGLPLAPTVDPVTGLPVKVEPPPVLGSDPKTGYPIEVDTKVGKPKKDVKPAKFPRAAESHKFSSTQVNLPSDLAFDIQQFGRRIPDESLADHGREMDTHVTVKYGLHTSDAALVQRALENSGPMIVTLGETSWFETDDADVVIIKVLSADLQAAHRLLSTQLEVTDTHPEYIPHVTIAYVKKGLGEQYAYDDTFVGRSFVAHEIVFTSKEGPVTVLRTAGGPGSGYFGHVGRKGKIGGSGPSIHDGVNIIPGNFQWNNLGERRRFMYHPATGEMVIGAQGGRPGDHTSHAEEFDRASQLGAVGTYDSHLKGYLEAGKNPRVILYGESGEYLPGGRDNPTGAFVTASDALAQRLVDAGAPPETIWFSTLTNETRPLREVYPELFAFPKAAEGLSETDQELLHILEAAIQANNTDVIDRILGITHLGGAGSGHHGHAGRPGKKGGSAAATGATGDFATGAKGHGLTVRAITDLDEDYIQVVENDLDVTFSRDPATLDPRAAEGIIQAMDDLKAQHPEMYARFVSGEIDFIPVTIEGENAEGMGAVTDQKYKHIMYNTTHTGKVSDTINTVAQASAMDKGLTGDAREVETTRAIMLHEVGHLADGMDRHLMRPLQEAMIAKFEYDQDSLPSFIARTVSNYGATHPAEAAAEVYSNVLLGRKNHPAFDSVVKVIREQMAGQ